MTRTTTITATYRIVTPMFCAGADQKSAELRLPSFKGALRFWWRSLMWGKVENHSKLRRREAELFGASDTKTGQSKVRLRITRKGLGTIERPPAIFEDGRLSGAHYLGYGVMEAFPSKNKGTKAGQLTRGMLSGGTFAVECRFSAHTAGEQIDEVQRSLILLGTVGGLGSKSRKGFGSLTLTELAVNGKPIEFQPNPSDRLKTTIDDLPSVCPEWTAWCSLARIVVAHASNATRPVQLLDRIGREQVHFRSWGRNGTVLGEPSEQNFQLDHHLSKGQSVSIDYPLRVAFGLPHNYGKGTKNSVQPARNDRRASPLFIHFDQPTENQAATAVLVFLPSTFLPSGEKLRVFGNDVTIRNDDEFWFPVHAFLDRLVSDGAEPKSRPGYDNFPNESQWWQKKTLISAKEVSLG
ncbi:MAG: type III-B CRISPR module RAMP protein Cmr1 [Candidatus Paceibacterota bacterium]